jgi:hypothetical protein
MGNPTPGGLASAFTTLLLCVWVTPTDSGTATLSSSLLCSLPLSVGPTDITTCMYDIATLEKITIISKGVWYEL